MTRMNFYMKLDEVVDNLPLYIDLARENKNKFNYRIYVPQKIKVEDISLSAKRKNIIDKLVEMYGIAEGMEKLSTLISLIDNGCVTNSVFKVVMQEILDELEQLYLTELEFKLVTILNIPDIFTSEGMEKVITIINSKRDSRYLLGIDETLEDQEQLSLFESKNKAKRNSSVIMVMRRLKTTDYLANYVNSVYGVDNFCSFIYQLFECLSSHEIASRIDPSFAPMLLREIERIKELIGENNKVVEEDNEQQLKLC